MLKKCLICRKIFKIKPYMLKKGNGKYCSRECYGISIRGKPSHMKGKHPSKETREKMSIAAKNRSPETQRKMNEARKGQTPPMLGKHHSIETRKKMSDAKKGMYIGENNPFYGKSIKGADSPTWKGGMVAFYERKKHDFKYIFTKRMSALIRGSLKHGKRGKHWEDIVGYSCEELQKRLESTMPEGYTWQDYIDRKLHLDHIIPISAFDFDDMDQINFQRCWALENLRLYPAHDNMSKNDKIIKPFQMCLKI